MYEAGLDYTVQTDGYETDVDDRPVSEEIRREMQYNKNANLELHDKEVMKAGMY